MTTKKKQLFESWGPEEDCRILNCIGPQSISNTGADGSIGAYFRSYNILEPVVHNTLMTSAKNSSGSLITQGQEADIKEVRYKSTLTSGQQFYHATFLLVLATGETYPTSANQITVSNGGYNVAYLTCNPWGFLESYYSSLKYQEAYLLKAGFAKYGGPDANIEHTNKFVSQRNIVLTKLFKKLQKDFPDHEGSEPNPPGFTSPNIIIMECSFGQYENNSVHIDSGKVFYRYNILSRSSGLLKSP